MKSNQRASTKDKNSSIFSVITDFVSYNTFVLVVLIFSVWFHQLFVVGSTVNELEENQNKMLYYLKENISKVYFLSASGVVMTATRNTIGYSDERFKSYLMNEILDSLIAGNVVISSNYTNTFTSTEDVLAKNKRINEFYTRFVSPHYSVMEAYARSLYRAMVEGKYPEYINVFSSSYTSYNVVNASKETNYMHEVSGVISLKLVVKSWIRDLKAWDTRETNIDVSFTASIDTNVYVNVGNPFGIHFKALNIPILHKPTGTQIREEKEKRL